MTALLRGRYEVDVRVDSGCVYTIADFENVMEDSNGTKSKKKVLVDVILLFLNFLCLMLFHRLLIWMG